MAAKPLGGPPDEEAYYPRGILTGSRLAANPDTPK